MFFGWLGATLPEISDERRKWTRNLEGVESWWSVLVPQVTEERSQLSCKHWGAAFHNM